MHVRPVIHTSESGVAFVCPKMPKGIVCESKKVFVDVPLHFKLAIQWPFSLQISAV